MKQWRVGVFLFNDVEVLDFAGPYEVFSTTLHKESIQKPFEVKTIAQTRDIIRAVNGLKVVPDLCFSDFYKFDIIIIPGGYGAEHVEINNQMVIHWIKEQKEIVEIMASVCTGAFLLGRAGILDGKKVTTHWADYDRLANEFKEAQVVKGVRFVDQGSVITAGGISSGINMSLHIVGRLLGKDVAQITARRMEYEFDI